MHRHEEGWIAEFAKQTLSEIPTGDTATLEYSDLHYCLTSALEKVRVDNAPLQQSAVDELYTALVAHILQGSTAKRASRRVSSKQRTSTHKRKRKRYVYGRTQELYKKNPGALAKYIRDGTPWLDDRRVVLSSDTIGEFYETLWGQRPDITIPFRC